MNSYSYIAFLTPVLCSVVHGDLNKKRIDRDETKISISKDRANTKVAQEKTQIEQSCCA